MRRWGHFVCGIRCLGAAIVMCGLSVSGLAASAEAAEPYGPLPLPRDEIELPARKPAIRFLRLKHHWTGERLGVVYRIGDDYRPGAMAAINHFMRDWRCEKTIAMDPRLFDRLYDLQQTIGDDRTIRVISGYRSEGYNASLLLAGHSVDPYSQHMFGRAVDIFVPGLPLGRLKEAAETLPEGGTGYYPFSGPRFVHIDTGPERNWSEMDPGERRKLRLPQRERKRLTLDCSLTMAEVLREVPVGEVLAALPAGASTIPAAKFQKASYSRPWSDDDGHELESMLHVQDGRGNAQWNRFCSASKPLAALQRLEAPQAE